MRWSTVALVVLGLVAALGAAVLVTFLKAGARRDARSGEPKDITIYVASRDIQANEVIDADSVATSTVAPDQAPQDYVPSAALIIGRVLSIRMVKGQVFRSLYFVTEGSGAHLASALAPGMKAFPVPVSRGSSLEGLLYPGSSVDVLACFDSVPHGGLGVQESVSVPLLERIQVLAVERDTVVATEGALRKGTSGPGSRTIVTLMVDSAQARALQLALEHGSLMLAMRNPVDNSKDPQALTKLTDFPSVREIMAAAAQPPKAAPPPVPPPIETVAVQNTQANGGPKTQTAEAAPPAPPPVREYKVTIIRGSSTEVVTFSSDEGW